MNMTESSAALVRTVLIAFAGGSLAWCFGIPLPWLLGSAMLVGLTSWLGLGSHVPSTWRQWMMAVIGVKLGEAFNSSIFADASHWLLTLCSTAVCTLFMACCAVFFLKSTTQQSWTTAFFSGAPGGLSQMVALSSESSADVRVVSILHTMRLTLIVFLVPSLVFYFVEGLTEQNQLLPLSPEQGSLISVDTLVLVFCLLAYPVATRVRLPSAALLGPLIMSAIVHYWNLVDTRMPDVLVVCAQLVFGSAIGVRFSGIKYRELLSMAAIGLAMTLILSAVAMLFSVALWWATDYGFLQLLIAFLPGGATEMTLIAFALDMDPAFVSSHHLFRMLLVVLVAPFVVRWTESLPAS